MINKENIQHEVETTLRSLDGISRAEANPFLFTRIKARMQRESRWEKLVSFISRPAVVLAALIMVMAVNGWSLLNQPADDVAAERTSMAASDFDDEYDLVSSINYDYENTPGQ